MNVPVIAYFSPGPIEILVIALVVLLLFGSRLPGTMRSLGQSIVEFRKGMKATDDTEEQPAAPESSKTNGDS